MPETYFSRVFNDTSWNSLFKIVQSQKKHKCKPLPYKIFIEISLSISEFNILANQPSKPYSCYLPYAFKSIPDENGIWNCILICNKTDNRKIILYTAGRTFPLYASIVN